MIAVFTARLIVVFGRTKGLDRCVRDNDQQIWMYGSSTSLILGVVRTGFSLLDGIITDNLGSFEPLSRMQNNKREFDTIRCYNTSRCLCPKLIRGGLFPYAFFTGVSV